MEILQSAANIAVIWFEPRHVISDKCHVCVRECILANIMSTSVIDSYEENLLGNSIDRDLTHVNTLYRQCKILPFYKGKTLMNTFYQGKTLMNTFLSGQNSYEYIFIRAKLL